MSKFSIFALFLGLSLLLMGIFGITPLGSKADEYAAELSEDSIKTFLALRVVNAGLSLAQEVEFTGSIGVLSGSARPLKILEPLDDAVEYLSTAVFIAGSFALVVASILQIAGPIGLSVLGFGLIMIGINGSKFIPEKFSSRLEGFSTQVMITGALLYFVVLSFAFASVINKSIGDAAWSRHAALLNQVAEEMNAIGMSADEDLSRLLSDADYEAIDEPLPTLDLKNSADESSGVINKLTNFGRSTVKTAGEFYDDTREAASDAVTSIREGAGRAVHWSRVSAQAAEIILKNADDLMIAFFAILAAYMFKLMALPLMTFLILSRLLKAEQKLRLVNMLTVKKS